MPATCSRNRPTDGVLSAAAVQVKLEVAIGRNRAVGERDHAGRAVRTVDFDVMEVALDFANRNSRLQPDADRRGIDRRVVPRIEDRRRNARRSGTGSLLAVPQPFSPVRRSTVCTTGAGL